ncbi:MAG: hypothetical protein CL758_03480 [Chloroflexi bacterium]|nr:hypothetical protein [Chloroflexota bacterium]|tara:strand:+ start:1219 stop:2292 length:1074 start_codon:yes stop_codon:yes gene_type:complete
MILEEKIIFYAENRASINHLRPLMNEFILRNQQIVYATSVENDLNFSDEPLVKIIKVGKGMARINFFLKIETKIFVTDMPDIEKYHLKRSRKFNVHYIYVFHSVFSTHSYLRKGALDHYDTIFCVGDHHIKEILETEKMCDLEPKKLVKYGFPRIEEVLKNVEKKDVDSNLIILAPSYGKDNFLLKHGQMIINILLENNFIVFLRPHYRIFEENAKKINQIISEFEDNKNFIIENGIIPHKIFNESLCMITDWSGISFEYAFAQLKPVIFIDMPMKNMNSDYKKFLNLPVEISMREKIGHVLQEEQLDELINVIHYSLSNKLSKKDQIQKCFENTIFNIGSSTNIGYEYIQKILTEK